MKIPFLFFFGALFLARLHSQPTIQWQKCLGGSLFEHAKSIKQTNDGGYVVVGYTLSSDGDISNNAGFFDIWVVKLDNTGTIQWEKTLGGSYDDWASDIKQTTDGGYILAGQTESNDGDVSGNHGSYDAWVIKLSSTGAIEWQKTLGGSGWDEANSIDLPPDGGYIIAGGASSNNGDVSGNHGYSDFWIVKLTNSGDIQWQKCLGGSSEDRALSIKKTFDGGYIVVGETLSNNGDVSGNNGDSDLWVVKLNNSGEMEWQNALGGSGLDVASDVVETNGGYVVCGYAGSYNNGEVTGSHGHFDYWIVKLSKLGELLWQKPFGGSNFDYGRTIVQTKDGNLLVAGEVKSSDGQVEGNNGIQIVWILKLNEMGDLLWKKPLGGTNGEGCYSIQQLSDHGYILAGYTWSNDGDVSGNHGEADFWIVKLAPESSPTSTPSSLPLAVNPNPATNTISLNIQTSVSIDADEPTLNVCISDLLGREFSRLILSSNESIDIATFPKGLYLLSAITPSGKVFSGKFSKQD